MESVPYLGHTLTRWRVGASTFLALPELGARLVNWNLTHADGSVRDVIYWPELTTLDGVARVRGGNPILFPFNARTFHQGAIHQWKDPDGQVRPMPMHGIARQGKFRVTHQHELGFTAVLEPDAAAQEAYPFAYEFAVTYRFASTGLSCEFSLENRDQRPIPWSAGHHFYFTVPWEEGLQRRDYAIRIPAARTVRQDAAGQLTPGPTLALEESLDRSELVDTIHLGLRQSTVVFGPRGTPGEVRVQLGTDPVPPSEAAIVTWSGAPDAPYYCVEPWMGPPNAAEHGIGLHWVPPRQTRTFSVAIDVA